MKKKKLVIGLFILFICLLSLTIYTSFSSNIDTQEIVIKSMTPVYDETSTVKVDNNNVVFNDKNQVVKYNVVLENTQNYDVKITDINLTTPTEEFLSYKVEGISTEDEISANSTKELTVSFETMRIDGWGRNFADELTANISFEKVSKQEEIPPVEEDKNEERQPEAPAANIEEIVKESEKIEVESITNNTIEFKDGFKVEAASKVEIWIYPETEFYGYKEVDETQIIKEIVLDKNKLDELEITPGEHNILLTTEEKEILGYIDIYINEDKEISKEKPQDSTDKEESSSENNTTTKPGTSSSDKTESNKEDKQDNKVENPYTSDKGLIIVLGIATCITGATILIVSNNQFTKYSILIIMLGSTLSLVNADEVLELPVKFNIEFKSQNVMKPSGCNVGLDYVTISDCSDYWQYYENIKNFNILTEKVEIEEYVYKFDVTEEQNGRVIAYVVNSDDNSVCYSRSGDEVQCYDVYLQADGIIYPNSDSSVYFGGMLNLSSIENLNNFDTSNVTNMFGMFAYAGYASSDFEVDISTLNTSKVTDMTYMFSSTGYNSTKLNTSITIKNPNTTSYNGVFSGVATKEGSQIKVNYTSETEELVDKMIATKTEGANVVKGNLIVDVDKLTTGDEIHISGEKFNVISQTEDTVTMLAQYNLGTDYRQSTTANNVAFSSNIGWEYTPGPKEIDIQTWTTNPKTYVNAYVEYLKEQLGDDTVTGDLITLKDLEALGCTVSSDYAFGSGGWNCNDSPYGWIANGQYWWTRSADSADSSSVWHVYADGYLDSYQYGLRGVRPVITISKMSLRTN